MKRKKITILSGGSAIKDIMFELLKHPHQVTRVVPSTDNGASSKELREVFGILSVGDIRQSLAISIPHTQSNKQLVKLINWRFPIEEFISIEELERLLGDSSSVLYQISNCLEIQRSLFGYLWSFLERAKETNINLSNGSIGNFILVGAYFEYGSNWNTAIARLESLFGCSSTVLPIYLNNNYHLKAYFLNGTVICGESEITTFGGDKRKEIESLKICKLVDKKFIDINPIVNNKVIEAIEIADTIIFSPGSFFTSILPHLINSEIPLALHKNRRAKKIFLVNLAQDSETIGYSARNIIEKIELIAKDRGYRLNDFITDIIINNHYKQTSFLNSQKNKKLYIEMGDLEIYKKENINIIIKELEDPWKRGEFDPQEVVKVLLDI